MELPIAPFGEVQVSKKSLLTYANFHYNINTELVHKLETNGGTVTQGQSNAIMQTGTNPAGAGGFASRQPARYVPGQGLMVIFSAIFDTPKDNSIQEIGYLCTCATGADGFLFNYQNKTFGINRKSTISGAEVDYRVPFDSFTNPENIPEFNPQKYNVFGITFQWLGAGEITYWIENKHVGLLVPVHKIRYANTNTEMSLYNPSLRLYAKAINTGNTTNLTLRTGNIAAYAFGDKELVGPRQAHRTTFAYTTGAERTVLAIENMDNVFGGTNNNRSVIFPTHMTFSTDGTKSAILRIKRCTVTGGTNAVINADTSIAKQYTGAPTVGSTKLLFSIEAAKIDQGIFTFPDDILLAPGEAIIVTAESAANSDINLGMSWKELL